MARIATVVMIATSFFSPPATAADASVALVVDVVGKVTVNAEPERELVRFDRLPAEAEITAAADASAVLAFMNGTRVEVRPSSVVILEDGGVRIAVGEIRELEAVATGPAIAAIPTASRPGRRSGAIRIRSGSVWTSQVENLYPRDGAAIDADDALLTFEPIPSVESYRIDIEDDRGETVFALETRSPQVAVPSGVLRPGVEYYWRVRSSGQRSLGGRGEALFVTLDRATVEDLASLERQLIGEASLPSLLLLAETNRSLGCFREACAHLVAATATTDAAHSLEREWQDFGCDAYHLTAAVDTPQDPSSR